MPDNGRVIVGCTHGGVDPTACSSPTSPAGRRSIRASTSCCGSPARASALRRGLWRPDPRRLGVPVKRVHDQFIEKGGRF